MVVWSAADKESHMLEQHEYKKYGVLFVDDEELAILTFQRLFGDVLTIYTAQDGEEALNIIRSHPDIVLLVTDQRMPKVTGIELLKAVSHERPEIMNILITAYLDSTLVAEAMDAAHLYRAETKPYDPKALKEEILKGLERYSLLKELDRLYDQHMESIKSLSTTQRLTAISLLAAGASQNINNAIKTVNALFAILPPKRAQDTDFWKKFDSIESNEVNRIHHIVERLYSAFQSHKKEDLEKGA